MIKRRYYDLKKNTRDYKRYTNLLGSDIASLKVEGGEGLYTINFGEDGTYKIYTTKDYTEEEIPKHYAKLYNFRTSIKLIDDDDFIEFTSEIVEVYKAGFSVLVNLKSV